MTRAETVDAAIIGGGPAGLVAALSLAVCGVKVGVIAPTPARTRIVEDGRTSALMASSVELLKNIGVWDLCAAAAAPLEGVRIVDQKAGLLRAPEVLFRAHELGLRAFGANIPNCALNTALEAAVQARAIRRLPTFVASIDPRQSDVRLELADGRELHAALAVAADGRRSLARAVAEIATREWRYPQAALVTSFRHTRAHGAITTELHRRAGPLTLVPLPGHASSLVWVEDPAEAERLAALDAAEFLGELDAAVQGLLGDLSHPTPRIVYPIAGLSALRMAKNRICLVGEAAHVVPPIGAQGLNLSLRDAAVLADCVAEAHTRGGDIGNRATLEAYETARAADVASRTITTDLLNRSLLSDFLPLEALRGVGLHVLANVPFARELAMRAGLASAGPTPRLMRPAPPPPGT